MSIMNLSLKNKVAVVTGAAGTRGIGRAIALNLAAAGADVAVCDLNTEGRDYNLAETANEIRKLGRRAFSERVDVTNEKDVSIFFGKVAAEFGTVDILVNNAGILKVALLLQMTESTWDKVMSVNMKGVLFCSKAAAKIMIEHKTGNIINIASTAGLRGSPPNSSYGTSKAGVIYMTQWIAQELAPHGIRVNAIAPGPIVTDIYRNLPPEQLQKEFEELKKHTPLNVLAEPAGIADLAVFLASEASRYITGQIISVDGGLSLY